MKNIINKIFSSIIGIIIVFSFLSSFIPNNRVSANSSSIDNTFTVNQFTSKLQFTDSGVKVNEKIDVDFVTDKHGIYRYLPLFYEYNNGNQSKGSQLKITVNSITDASNTPVHYEIIDIRDSIYDKYNLFQGLFYSAKEIKIGNPSIILPPGKYEYNLSYTIENFPSNLDIFQYGLTGTGWGTTIENYNATLNFIKPPTNIRCEKGLVGTVGQDDCNINKIDENTYQISSTDIQPAYGLQFIASGVNFNHSIPDSLVFLQYYWYLLIPVLGILLLFLYWFFTQRSPKGTGVIVPQFGIPEDLRPGEIGTIYDDSVDKVDVSATIIDLAVKGYIKITNLDDDKDIILEKINNDDSKLRDYEKILMMKLFFASDKCAINGLAEGSLSDTYDSIKRLIYLWGIQQGYYKKKPDKVNSVLYAAIFTAILIFPAPLFGLLSIVISVILAVLIFVPAIIIFYIRQYKSYKGVLLREKIQGLKLFIEYAKKDQLEMLNTPMNKQQIFETYLPYAMVFGLHKSWTEAFKNMNLDVPSWYVGPSVNANNFFTNLYFYNVLNSFSSNINSSFSVPPSRSGSGFVGGIGGFSGGGGIGGGFSGGGGGSW